MRGFEFKSLGSARKFAVTDFAVDMVMVQVSESLSQPSQAAKYAPCEGVAIKVTEVSAKNSAEQVLPQLMLPDELVIVPDPTIETVNL